MARKGRARLRVLTDLVADAHPDLDAAAAVARGFVLVDGLPVTNPASLVRSDATVRIRPERPARLRGEQKLAAALGMFDVSVDGRVALDLGAAAGGFTRTLLHAGAARVYAVDAGHGQLLGSLRQHPAVVNLERTNLAELDRGLVPDVVDIVTVDLSYVPLARAIPQLNDRIALAADADLVGLVKPQFELALPEPPTEPRQLARAVERASAGIEGGGWSLVQTERSPVTGARGSVEFLLHARRRSPPIRRPPSPRSRAPARRGR